MLALRITHQEAGLLWSLPRWLSGKESTCNAGDMGLVPGSGRAPGGENSNLLQHSCGKSHGQRSLVGYSPCGWKELDTTEHAHMHGKQAWIPTPALPAPSRTLNLSSSFIKWRWLCIHHKVWVRICSMLKILFHWFPLLFAHCFTQMESSEIIQILDGSFSFLNSESQSVIESWKY